MTKQFFRVRKFLERARAELPSDELELPSDELESFSDEAIDWIRNNACEEPENKESLGLLNGPKRSN